MVYREPQDIPYTLIENVAAFLSESLYVQALNILISTVASRTYASEKAYRPTQKHLALAATFLVHPSTTTNAKSAGHKEACNAALQLLRLTSCLISPKDANFNLAFNFEASQNARGGRQRRDDSPVLDRKKKNEVFDPHALKYVELADAESLWTCADDFWHAVGWAFNCSVLHPERWEHWNIWLKYMCEVILDDWKQREAEYAEAKAAKKSMSPASPEENIRGRGARKNEDEDLDIFRGSLIFQYISAGSLAGRNSRIIKSIFADGSSNSVNMFRQVFTQELKRSGKSQSRKRVRDVNIDREEYGDYLSDDDSNEEEDEIPDTSNPQARGSLPPMGANRPKRTRRGTRSDANSIKDPKTKDQASLTNHSGSVAMMGGLESIYLRKMLLHILSLVSERLPQDYVSIYDLYPMFVDYIRPLPLPVFQAFVSPTVLPVFSSEEHTTFCEILLFTLRESSAPASSEEYLNQEKLEKCFLPYTAANANRVNNAKVSILLEALVILLAKNDMLVVTPLFRNAVEEGIHRRADRVHDERRGVNGRRNANSRNKDSIEWCWLVESGDRLMLMMDLLSLKDEELK
ncbi:hypothetical protein N7495_003674 [Penicillium taxi]|uniref:uncharacterized protein n=1 Tax=Penicillium taxi TaxID=168475 RepID=UPI00254572A7|nr:uncharacterized protein N7495_003674 [Penicillium taxi]KAJ5898930.1 hypothetical protein N7495_003674 [Penicillium taxi]